MKRSVLYFTRSGDSEKIAERIAGLLSTKPVKIDDGMDWSGDDGYKKAAKYSMGDIKVPAIFPDDVKDSDEFIVVSPLWCGKIANAVTTFFESIPKEKTHLVVSSIGSKLVERDGYLSVTDLVIRDGVEVNDKKIFELVENLKK